MNSQHLESSKCNGILAAIGVPPTREELLAMIPKEYADIVMFNVGVLNSLYEAKFKGEKPVSHYSLPEHS